MHKYHVTTPTKIIVSFTTNHKMAYPSINIVKESLVTTSPPPMYKNKPEGIEYVIKTAIDDMHAISNLLDDHKWDVLDKSEVADLTTRINNVETKVIQPYKTIFKYINTDAICSDLDTLSTRINKNRKMLARFTEKLDQLDYKQKYLELEKRFQDLELQTELGNQVMIHMKSKLDQTSNQLIMLQKSYNTHCSFHR